MRLERAEELYHKLKPFLSKFNPENRSSGWAWIPEDKFRELNIHPGHRPAFEEFLNHYGIKIDWYEEAEAYA
jgi:hypothetical protein